MFSTEKQSSIATTALTFAGLTAIPLVVLAIRRPQLFRDALGSNNNNSPGQQGQPQTTAATPTQQPQQTQVNGGGDFGHPGGPASNNGSQSSFPRRGSRSLRASSPSTPRNPNNASSTNRAGAGGGVQSFAVEAHQQQDVFESSARSHTNATTAPSSGGATTTQFENSHNLLGGGGSGSMGIQQHPRGANSQTGHPLHQPNPTVFPDLLGSSLRSATTLNNNNTNTRLGSLGVSADTTNASPQSMELGASAANTAGMGSGLPLHHHNSGGGANGGIVHPQQQQGGGSTAGQAGSTPSNRDTGSRNSTAFPHRRKSAFSEGGSGPSDSVRLHTPTLVAASANTVGGVEAVLTFATLCARAPISDRQAIVNTIQDQMASLTDAEAVYLWVYDPATTLLSQSSLREVVVAESSPTLVAESFRTGQPICLEHEYATPMVVLGTVLAIVNVVFRHESSQAHRERLTQPIEAMTAIAGTFLQNSALFEDLVQHKDQTDAMLRMARMLSQEVLDEQRLVGSIIHTARELCHADRCSVFLARPKRGVLRAHFEIDGRPVEIPMNVGIAGHVARTGEIVNIKDCYSDSRFNQDVDRRTGYRTHTMLAMPVSFEGQIVAVAQLINKRPITQFGKEVGRVFTAADEVRFQAFSPYIGICLRNCRASAELREEKIRCDTILDLAEKLATTDIRKIDDIMRFILKEAHKLLNADRASVFVVDKEHSRLHSRPEYNTGGIDIKVELGSGIVGKVASTGQADIVDDAYEDSRFNQNVDRQLGYKTTSMLTEPIFAEGGRGEVIAVAQLINKLDPESDNRHIPFTKNDVALFRHFALFAGMALSNANLLQFAIKSGEEAMKLTRFNRSTNMGGSQKKSGEESNDAAASSDSKNSVDMALAREEQEYLDLLEVEVSEAQEEAVKTAQFDMFRVRRNFPDTAPDVVARLIIHLLWSTGYPMKFGCDLETITRFVLACRRKYRAVPYHNFYHAADVCQTVYCMLYHGKAGDFFEPLECYVLLITALVHDLDHMGLNNSYHLRTSSPLGILSSATGSSCVLEVHHCNLAFEILDVPSQNVFKGLDSASRITAMRRMVDCILATDMARHQEFCKLFQKICIGGETPFDIKNDSHRLLAMQQITKAADISNVTKPFQISKLWGTSVTEEFYRQGDQERAAGVDVLPMNDRRLGTELAKGQLGFINFMAESFFKALVDGLFTDLKYATDQLAVNKRCWADELELSAIAAGKSA